MKAEIRRIFLVLLQTFSCGALVLGQSPPIKVVPVREADAICGQCHLHILQSYLKTPMANASGQASERAYGGTFKHQLSGVSYEVASTSDGVYLEYNLPGEPSIRGSERLEYFLGSGHLGLTYLYSKNGYLFESPIAYYAKLDGYAMKPGLDKSPNMPGALTMNSSCLRCHMSAVQRQDAGTENHYRSLPFLNTGITCESCHGETGRHIATKGVTKVANPGRLDPVKRDSVCILCHLEGDTSVEHRDRSILDFQPGEDINHYISYYSYATQNTTKRAVSEVEQFAQSQCKITTGAAMSCTTCHDPHSSPIATEKVAFYRAKCLTCHGTGSFAERHFTATPDCTSCHMPKTSAENIAHVAWTDHRIRKRPETAQDQSDAPHSMELVPILTTQEDARNLGLAYYDLVVRGETSEKARALQQLSRIKPSDSADDILLLRSLGILAEMDGERARAEALYRAVLAQDSDNLTALTNLGTILAKRGELQAAIVLWKRAFERNEDIVGLGMNLARAQCALGSKSEAEATLERVLVYSPDMRNLQDTLAKMRSGQTNCPPSSYPSLHSLPH